MTKVIILPNENLDQFYARTMQYLHKKYHTYPSALNKSSAQKSLLEQGKEIDHPQLSGNFPHQNQISA